jgi:hypothetical protein
MRQAVRDGDSDVVLESEPTDRHRFACGQIHRQSTKFRIPIDDPCGRDLFEVVIFSGDPEHRYGANAGLLESCRQLDRGNSLQDAEERTCKEDRLLPGDDCDRAGRQLFDATGIAAPLLLLFGKHVAENLPMRGLERLPFAGEALDGFQGIGPGIEALNACPTLKIIHKQLGRWRTASERDAH